MEFVAKCYDSEMHKAWHTTVVNGTGWREEVNCPYINTGKRCLLF